MSGHSAIRLLTVAAGAMAAGAALTGLRRITESDGIPRPRWARRNYRGNTVNLVGGPAVAAAAAVAAGLGAPDLPTAAAAWTAGLTGGAVGLYDDLVGTRPQQQAKGFRGHLGALRRGQLTSGTVKLAGMAAAGLATGLLLESRTSTTAPVRLARVVAAAGVVAGGANLLNLLDLRPGRALKVSLLGAAALSGGPAGGLVAGPLGAAAAALPEDLAERTMLGDCGANALGALLGTALVARTGLTGRLAALGVIAGLTAASERVSFTQVIARTPGLRELDEWGRHV